VGREQGMGQVIEKGTGSKKSHFSYPTNIRKPVTGSCSGRRYLNLGALLGGGKNLLSEY